MKNKVEVYNKFKDKVLSELKETVFWNECNGNAGYKLISVSNVEILIELAINRTKFAIIDGELELE